MDETAIKQYITTTFKGIHVAESDGNFFFFYSPNDGAENKFPFVTLVTNDAYDKASNLSRPSVFRLNIGVSKETYLGLFGKQPARAGASGVVETGHDFTALDQIMPHPIYASMFWVCLLNPSRATFEKVEPLLAEAYERATHKEI